MGFGINRRRRSLKAPNHFFPKRGEGNQTCEGEPVVRTHWKLSVARYFVICCLPLKALTTWVEIVDSFGCLVLSAPTFLSTVGM